MSKIELGMTMKLALKRLGLELELTLKLDLKQTLALGWPWR